MRLGLYYHVPVAVEGSVRLPSYLGVFVDELARQAGEVVLYGHAASDSGMEDYVLDDRRVRFVDLGPRGSFLARTLRPRLSAFDAAGHGLDAMMVRGPSPLLPHIVRASGRTPTVILLVGDYGNSSWSSTISRSRSLAIAAWVRLYAMLQRRAARRSLVLVNDPSLRTGPARTYPRVENVFTSTLNEADLSNLPSPRAWTDQTGHSDPLRMLFTGRVADEKGLFEATEAIALLQRDGVTCELRMLGWSEGDTLDRILERASVLGVPECVHFDGYRAAGPELLAAYADAHTFVMPSYGEGFPRSMLEAMAVGVPVVATRVGGISEVIQPDEQAVLVEPRSGAAIASAVRRLLDDRNLRERVVRNAQAWAHGRTNEKSCSLIFEHIREWTDM